MAGWLALACHPRTVPGRYLRRQLAGPGVDAPDTHHSQNQPPSEPSRHISAGLLSMPPSALTWCLARDDDGSAICCCGKAGYVSRVAGEDAIAGRGEEDDGRVNRI
jgi:hypothetical protein